MVTQEVIKKAQQGDSDAFAQIYNETIKTAYYVAKRILLDEQAVEDVLQESYIAVYEHLGDYKTGNFQGWVDTIVANRSKNYLRKKNPILFSQMETEDDINIEFEEEKIEFRPDEKVDYDETKRLVMKIVDGLSDEQRLAIILFYFEQRSVKEIAEICECSENTVKSRLNYARKKIKEDVLELEKKGTKLYSISVLPFLYWLFREEFMACEVPDTTNTVVANSTGKAIEKVAGEAAKAGMALGTKIAIGVAVATLSVGGIALGNTLLKNNTPPTEQSSESNSQQNTEHEQGVETEQTAQQESENVTEQITQQESETATELTKEEFHVMAIEESVIQEFLESYEPNDTLEVFELRGVPRTTTYYVEDIGLEYVTFIADRKNILVISVPYSEDGEDGFVYNDLKFYYYDEVTETFVEFTNPPDLEYDEWGSPSCYGYDVYANTDRATNRFSLYNGYVRIGITVNESTLEWIVDSMQIGGSPLEWKSMDGMGEAPEIDELIQD